MTCSPDMVSLVSLPLPLMLKEKYTKSLQSLARPIVEQSTQRCWQDPGELTSWQPSTSSASWEESVEAPPRPPAWRRSRRATVGGGAGGPTPGPRAGEVGRTVRGEKQREVSLLPIELAGRLGSNSEEISKFTFYCLYISISNE